MGLMGTCALYYSVHYSVHAHIYVKGIIEVQNTRTIPAPNNRNKK